MNSCAVLMVLRNIFKYKFQTQPTLPIAETCNNSDYDFACPVYINQIVIYLLAQSPRLSLLQSEAASGKQALTFPHSFSHAL